MQKKKKEKRIPVVHTYCYYNPLFLKLVRRENLFAHLNLWTRITSVFRLSHGRETTTCSIHISDFIQYSYLISAILDPPFPIIHPMSSLGTVISCVCCEDWGRFWCPVSAARAGKGRAESSNKLDGRLSVVFVLPFFCNELSIVQYVVLSITKKSWPCVFRPGRF